MNDYEGVWMVREFADFGSDDIITSRYPKMHPHTLLSDYEYTVWMDGNLVINSNDFYRAIDKKIEEGIIYSGVKHPDKTCVYEDIVACVHAMRDRTSNILRAANFLLKEHFPRHYGMYENNIILRRTDSVAVQAYNNHWWELYLAYPHRDQFMAPYCLREHRIPFDYLFPEGMSAKNCEWIKYIEHNESPKSFLRYWYDFFACRMRTYLMLIYLKIRT